MDYLEGGELFDKICRQQNFSEREASAILKVLASTLDYLHQNMASLFVSLNEPFSFYVFICACSLVRVRWTNLEVVSPRWLLSVYLFMRQ